MSASESTTIYKPAAYSHRRTPIRAIQHDGTEHCRRAIVAWVTTDGGEAGENEWGGLWVLTPQGRRVFVGAGDYVACGPRGEWYTPGPDVILNDYDPVAGEDYSAVLDRGAVAEISREIDLAPETLSHGDLVARCRLLVASHEQLR